MSAKRVLVCSPVTPAYDRESGSQRIFDLVEFLREAGWEVSFAARTTGGMAGRRAWMALPSDRGRRLCRPPSGRQHRGDRAPGSAAGQGSRLSALPQFGVVVARALRGIQAALESRYRAAVRRKDACVVSASHKPTAKVLRRVCQE